MRRIVRNALREIGYNDAIEAGDGAEALQQMEACPVDFVITDWNMPVMSGLELARSIRSHPTWGNLPILMITTRGTQDDVVAAMQARVNNYVVKPFTPDTLREKINFVLSVA
jgi:two-component system, chemotaxis family, chemotaxis protein CheY